VALAALAVVAHLLLGVLVLALRTVRVIVTAATDTAVHAEQQLAARTGRPALSQTGIGVLAAAFVQEFLTTYRQPTR
jgi:cytochrome b561